MKKKATLTRRGFVRAAGAGAAAFTIVPRHVMAGGGETPPSEKLNIAGIGVGGQGSGVVRSVVAQNSKCDLTQLSEIIKRTVFKITRAGELIGREMAELMGVEFGIVDISLAPTTSAGDSVAEIIEAMGVKRMGLPGSTAALALLINAVKKGGAMASSYVGGLSGVFIPVMEDQGMSEAAKRGAIDITTLHAMSSVCALGIDMVLIPGDTTKETISAIIADQIAIAIQNGKPAGVRIIPVPKSYGGEMVEFGGLMGKAPVLNTKPYRSDVFIKRGGRTPAPFHSLRG